MVQLLIILMPQLDLSLGQDDEIYTDKNHISLPEVGWARSSVSSDGVVVLAGVNVGYTPGSPKSNYRL